jgi:hypothetical protein
MIRITYDKVTKSIWVSRRKSGGMRFYKDEIPQLRSFLNKLKGGKNK